MIYFNNKYKCCIKLKIYNLKKTGGKNPFDVSADFSW